MVLETWLRWGWVLVLTGVAGVNAHAQSVRLVPAAADYATNVLHNPWDMADNSDVYPLLWTHNLAAAQARDGVMEGTPRDADPHFWAQFPQIARTTTTLDQPFTAIDADRYTRLSFYMWLPENLTPGSTNGRVMWHLGGESVAQFDASYSESPMFAVYPGWRHYTLDLKALKQSDLLPGQRWAGPWAGKISGLRIDPALGGALPFKIGWIRLLDANDRSAKLASPATNAQALRIVSDRYAKGVTVATLPVQGDGSFDLADLPPGSYQMAALSDEDYTLAVRGDAWDMSSLSDLNWASRSGWTREGLIDSRFQGATASADPFLVMDIPVDKPVDAAKYRYLRIKMELSGVPAQESGLLVWWGPQPVDFSGGNSGFIPVQAGEKEYVIDLGTKSGWAGLVRALRIDPLNGPNAGSGVTVKISSVRLSRTATSNLQTVTPLPESLVINTPPQVALLAPSLGTGNDYARTVLGRPWNMVDTFSTPNYNALLNADFVTTIADLNLSGHFFRGVSQAAADTASEGDPSVYFLFQQNAKPIQADLYRILRVRMYVPFDATDQNELTVGAIARIGWKENDYNAHVTYDMPLLPGLRDLWVDMPQVRVEGSTGTWGNMVRYLRIDPFEFRPSRPFYLAGASLHTLPTYTDVLPLSLQLSARTDARLAVKVSVDNVEVAQTRDVAPGLFGLDVPLATVGYGSHALQVCVDDGLNSNCQALAIPFLRSADALAVSTNDANSLFDWVEAIAAPLLKPQGETSQDISGFYARCYAASGQCVAVKDQQVYYWNGSALQNLGSVGAYMAQAKAAGY